MKDGRQRQPTRVTRNAREALERADRLLEEHNLLRLEALMFLTERGERQQLQRDLAERGSSRPMLTRTDGRGKEVRVAVDPTFGVPGDMAYRIFHAAMYKLTHSRQCGARGVCTLSPSVYFTKRELARLSGRSWAGGKDDDDYYAAVMQLYHADYTLLWRDKEQGTEKEIHLRLFVTAFFSRRQGGAKREFDQCMVDFHPRIVENYAAGYFRIFNMQRLLELRPVGMLLFKRLFLAFGYLKQQGLTDRELRFEKDYEAICREWLGGHRPRRYQSEIVRHLGVHLEALRQVGLLRKYQISKKAKKAGHKIAFWPGPGFDEDYALYYEPSATHLGSSTEFQEEHSAEAMALVGRFHGELGRTHREFGRREIEQAEALLREYGREAVEDLISFALEQRASNVEPQVFGFVLGYLERWKTEREPRTARQARRAAIRSCKLCNEAGMLEYRSADGFWRSMICPHNRQQLAEFMRHTGARIPELRL